MLHSSHLSVKAIPDRGENLPLRFIGFPFKDGNKLTQAIMRKLLLLCVKPG
jgi:hypothetical protein